jgi:hypothetical protein
MTQKSHLRSHPNLSKTGPIKLKPNTAIKQEKNSEPITIFSRRVQIGLMTAFVGLFLFALGARPNLFGLDRSPVMGFVQMTAFEIGLGMICLGGYFSLNALWKNKKPSIASEFGARFLATGYLISAFAGLADIIGMGSHHLPLVFFGPLQSFGVLLGQGLSTIGMLMLIPFQNGSLNGKQRGIAQIKFH